MQSHREPGLLQHSSARVLSHEQGTTPVPMSGWQLRQLVGLPWHVVGSIYPLVL